MHARKTLALVGIAGLLAVSVAVGASDGTVVESANGSAHWTIPLPNPFGVEVGNRTLSFNAHEYADGSVTGRFEYHQVVEGVSFDFNVDVTCLNVYDGNRAKLGGVVEVSNDPTVPVGMFGWFHVFDSGEGANAVPDQSSLVGFGDDRQRGVLQQPRAASLRALGRTGKRPSTGVAGRPAQAGRAEARGLPPASRPRT